MRLPKFIQNIMCVTALMTSVVAFPKFFGKNKKQSQQKQQQKYGGANAFAEKAKQLKEQEKKKQEQRQKKMGVLSDSQEADLKKLLNEYHQAKTAKEKVRIGSHLMPLAEKYLKHLTERNVLSSLLRDNQEMKLVGELATIVGDLQSHMKDAGTGIFTKIRKDIQQLADRLLTEVTYE